MRTFSSVVTGLLLAFAPLTSFAVTATALSSFEAIEEPLVKFFPATKKFVPDDFVNITDRGDGLLRMTDRFNADWWDGDRDTTNDDRQRAEVKGLGAHERDDETFIYATTWRTNPGFRGTAGFCHVFQLKALNGDSGSPLVTLSIHGDKMTVEGNPAGKKIIAREFPWKPATWQTVRIRIRTSTAANGELMASVDGDAFQGKTGVELSRPGANAYRPKWGLYRKALVGAPMGDDYVEHQKVSAQNVAQVVDDNAALENEARALAKKTSPAAAMAGLQKKPASGGRDFAIASLAAEWAQSDPPGAMAWAESQKASGVRLDAMARVFSRWTDLDVDAAAEWLRRGAPAAELDEIAWLFATDTTYRYVNRHFALEGAALIKDPALRAAAFEHVVLIWAREQPEAAIAFVRKTPALSDAQRETLMDKLPTRRAR